jgi:hypothetical protein
LALAARLCLVALVACTADEDANVKTLDAVTEIFIESE